MDKPAKERPLPNSPDSSELSVSKTELALQIISNLPTELAHFARIPCAMQSIYTGIIGGGVAAAAGLIATGSLRGLRFGVFGYAASAIASWHWCRGTLKDR